MTEQIFANNFWGLKDDGFHVLTAKMASTKKTFEEVKSFYNIRASLHEEFGRKLMKHAKVGMGREETGTLQALLSSAHKETEWIAQAHLNLAQKLKTRLEVDLDNFILDQKDKRKLTHTNVEKAHRYKQSNEAYLAKVKEKYESDCAKLITLQAQVPSATGREAERIKQRIDRTQHEIKIQEQEYQNACIKVADATSAWNKTWKLTCDTYQGMEQKRLEFLRHSFSMFINVLSSATSQDQESYERFWKSLDQYDPVNDIQIFISEKGTGPNIPEPEIFVDYMDDPAKTFQKHTVANFPCPTDLLTSISSPSESNPKPELTVRNPTAVLPDDSLLLKRVRSIAAPAPLVEAITPSKSTTEKRKSSIRIGVKPLPSISTPLTQQKTRHQRKASVNENYSSRSQQPNPPPPVIVVPDISSSSTTSASDEEEEQPVRRNRATKKIEEDGDITIDPRAKVVFAIGNNMFDLGHLGQDEKKSDQSPFVSSTRRLTTNRRRQPSSDLEAACNFSYQSLLEELGVFDKSGSSGSSQTSKNMDAPEKKAIIKRLSQRDRKPIKQQPQQQQQQQQQQYQPPDVYKTPQVMHAIQPALNGTIPQQQDMYNGVINNPDPYRKQQHHQQHQQQLHQQQYHNQYATQHSTIPSVGQSINAISHPYHSSSGGIYSPPSAAAQSGHQPTLFWAIAIGDWYSGKPEELQYARGTWLAVTEIRPDGWYYATKFDARLNTLTNEMGFVAQNYVQVHT